MSSCIFLKYSVLHVVYTKILDEICGDEVTIHISLFSLHFRGIITLDQASSLTTTIFDQAKTTLKPKSQQVFEDRRRQLKVIVDTTIQELQTLTIRYTPHPPTLLWNIHCTFIMFVWYKMKMPYWNKILFTLLFIQHRYMYVMWDLLQFKIWYINFQGSV